MLTTFFTVSVETLDELSFDVKARAKSPRSMAFTVSSRTSWRSPARWTRITRTRPLPYVLPTSVMLAPRLEIRRFASRLAALASAPPIGRVAPGRDQQRHVTMQSGVGVSEPQRNHIEKRRLVAAD